MIGRWERVIIACLLVLMVVLLMLLFYHNTTAESQGDILNISVLIQSPSDRFRKGLEKAARENNVDLRLETSFDANGQADIMQREVSNKADAIIIKAAGADVMQSYLTGMDQLVNIVTVDERLNAQGLIAHIGVDQRQLAETLADVVAERAAGESCAIVYSGKEMQYEAAQAALLREALADRGIECAEVTIPPTNLPFGLTNDTALVAVSPEMLQPLCDNTGSDVKIFGIGYESGVRNYLEEGRIEALVVYSEFDAGYLSLQAAAAAVSGGKAPEKQLQLYVADAESMYRQPVNHVLFPIE